MTLQAKGFRWSLGVHGVLILAVVVLQSFAVSQTKVTVIDFTLSGNNARPAVERTSQSQAPVVKQEPRYTKAIQPQEVLKKELAAKVPEKEIAKEVAEEQHTRHPEAKHAQSLSEAASTKEEAPTSLPQAVDGSGGTSADEKGNSTASPRGDGAGIPSENTAHRGAVDGSVSTQATTVSSGNAGAGTRPESSRAAYLKEHFVYIRDRITSSISYPHMARKMGWCGQVKIAFVVCEDGGVNDVRVVESSGFSLLDRNAVETVKNVAPFPSPPIKAEIQMAITYRLK